MGGGGEAKARAEAKAREEAEAKVRADAEAKAREQAEAKVRADAEAKAREQAEAKQREEADAKQRAEAEAKQRAEAEAAAKAREQAEATAAEAEEKQRADAEAKAREDAEAKVRAAADARVATDKPPIHVEEPPLDPVKPAVPDARVAVAEPTLLATPTDDRRARRASQLAREQGRLGDGDPGIRDGGLGMEQLVDARCRRRPRAPWPRRPPPRPRPPCTLLAAFLRAAGLGLRVLFAASSACVPSSVRLHLRLGLFACLRLASAPPSPASSRALPPPWPSAHAAAPRLLRLRLRAVRLARALSPPPAQLAPRRRPSSPITTFGPCPRGRGALPRGYRVGVHRRQLSRLPPRHVPRGAELAPVDVEDRRRYRRSAGALERRVRAAPSCASPSPAPAPWRLNARSSARCRSSMPPTPRRHRCDLPTLDRVGRLQASPQISAARLAIRRRRRARAIGYPRRVGICCPGLVDARDVITSSITDGPRWRRARASRAKSADGSCWRYCPRGEVEARVSQ